MNFIVTGHGNFATGLLSSVKLITGMERALKAVDFLESMSSGDLKEALVAHVHTEAADEKTLIFTDIAGGTPFNQSVLLKSENDNIEVFAGTNLPILVEAVLSQESESETFLSDLLDSGKSNIKRYGKLKSKKKQDFESDEGI